MHLVRMFGNISPMVVTIISAKFDKNDIVCNWRPAFQGTSYSFKGLNRCHAETGMIGNDGVCFLSKAIDAIVF